MLSCHIGLFVEHLSKTIAVFYCTVENYSEILNDVFREILQPTSAYQLQKTILKSNKIWCTSVVANCVRLQTFE